MSHYDLITCKSGLVIDVCEDTDEAERVRKSRTKAGYNVISVIGCDHVSLLDITLNAKHGLAPRKVYTHGSKPWIVVSADGEHPSKIQLNSDL